MPTLLRSPAAGAFLIGLLARVVGQVILGAYAQPQTWEYEAIADNLLAGRGYTYEIGGTEYVASQSSPLYIYLTALVYLVTGHSQAALLLLQAVLGGATAALAAWLAARAGSSVAGWWAGLLVALDPGLVVYAAELHSLTLDALAFIGLVCASVALPGQPGARRLVLLGALFGLAALTRSTALVILPVVLGWLVRYRAVRLWSRQTAALLGAALVVFAPWSIRSSLLLGQPVLVSSEATEWLWRGNNPAATGSSYTPDGRLMLEAAPAEFRDSILEADERARIGLYRDAALRFVREQPARAAGLYLEKLKSFWWSADSTGQFYPPDWRAGYLAWSAAILSLALVGCGAGLRASAWRPEALLVVLVLVVSSLAQSAFYVEGRHRLALEPLLLVLSGAGLWAAGSLTLGRRNGSVAEDREHGARLGVDRRRIGRRGPVPR